MNPFEWLLVACVWLLLANAVLLGLWLAERQLRRKVLERLRAAGGELRAGNAERERIGQLLSTASTELYESTSTVRRLEQGLARERERNAALRDDARILAAASCLWQTQQPPFSSTLYLN